MICVYSRFIVYLCFFLMVCSVAGENEDGSQNVTLEDDNQNMKDVKRPQENSTSTTQNPNSGMVSSDTMKKVLGSLMYSSLSMSNGNPNTNEGQEPHSQNNVNKRQLDELDDNSESTTTALNRDMGEETSNYIEEIAERNNLRTGIEVFSNKTLRENDSLGVSDTMTSMLPFKLVSPTEGSISPPTEGSISPPTEGSVSPSTEGSISPSTEGSIPPPTKGFTPKNFNPDSFTELPQNKQTAFQAQKMESGANPCSMSVMFLWLLSLSPWIL